MPRKAKSPFDGGAFLNDIGQIMHYMDIQYFTIFPDLLQCSIEKNVGG